MPRQKPDRARPRREKPGVGSGEKPSDRDDAGKPASREPGSAPGKSGAEEPAVDPRSRPAPPKEVECLDPETRLETWLDVPVRRVDDRFPDGSLRSRLHVRADSDAETPVRHGPEFRWFPNKQLWQQRVWVNGEQHGPYREWTEGGLLQRAGEFEHDMLERTWLEYREAGQIGAERDWHQGVQHGRLRIYYGDNALRSESNFVNGVQSGPEVLYHKNGVKEAAGDWENGERVGEWKYWHAGGQPKAQATYVGGRYHGDWIEWDEDGEVVERGHFEHGKAQGEWWELRGRVGYRHVCSFDAGLLHGVSRTWYPGSDQLMMETRYEHGLADGTERMWFQDGKPCSEVRYVKGRVAGPVRYWREDGTLWCSGDVVDGHREGTWTFLRSDGTVDSAWSGLYRADVRVAPLDAAAEASTPRTEDARR